MSDDLEKLRKQIVNLESRAGSLESRYDKLIGKAEHYAPNITSIMKEGVPLEIFSRLSIMNQGFDVHGSYPYLYYNEESSYIERSVDIYAVRDSVHELPERDGLSPKRTLPERQHILAEVKQRKLGVDWVFSKKPTKHNPGTLVKDIPIVNTGFESRLTDSGSASANPNAVDNAVAQLNQAWMPFQVGLLTGEQIERTGFSMQYAAVTGSDHLYMLLITNAKLKVFTPPDDFNRLSNGTFDESELFKEVGWVFISARTLAFIKAAPENGVRSS